MSFVAGTYRIRTNLTACEENKEYYRKLVVKHITKYHDPNTPCKYIGFPASKWRTEELLLKTFPELRCIGIERDKYTIMDCLSNFPYSSHHLKFPKSIYGFATSDDKHIVLKCESKNFFTLERNDFEQKHLYDKYCTGFTCAWLDPTSSFSGQSEDMLIEFGRKSHKGVVPFGVCLTNGHNPRGYKDLIHRLSPYERGSVNKLAEAVRYMVWDGCRRKIEIHRAEGYASKSGGRMVFLLYVIRPQKQRVFVPGAFV